MVVYTVSGHRMETATKPRLAKHKRLKVLCGWGVWVCGRGNTSEKAGTTVRHRSMQALGPCHWVLYRGNGSGCMSGNMEWLRKEHHGHTMAPVASLTLSI